MSFSDAIGLTAGLLLFAAAYYALRLCRLLATMRAGWWLFTAFSLLGLAHCALSVSPLRRVLAPEFREELIYMLICVLLLLALLHLESVLKQRRRLETEAVERQPRSELESQLESQVRKQTEELTKANEELQRTAARLQAEVAQRKRMQEEAEESHKEMLIVSRRAGMSEVATCVLHNVGNVLNSVNISATLVADHLAEFRFDHVARVASLLREHAADPGHFLTSDPKGKQLPNYLAQLARHLSAEQDLLLKEVGFVRTKIDHIKEIVATQQNYGKVSGLTEKVKIEDLIEDVLRIHGGELAQHAVEVRREFEPELPEIIMDKHKALQILLNLLSNAKHACVDSDQKQKQVTVRVTNGDDRVRVTMIDNGVGIPAANLGKVFNHGFTTRKKGGHGFGLHSGALAAREMGGVLVAQSDGPGKGAAFTLEIPLKRFSTTTES